MLARRRTFHHPTAGSFDLPMLVPSFSSKGSALKTHDEDDDEEHNEDRSDFSPVAYDLQEFGRFPATSALISAYDLHLRHFESSAMELSSPLDYLAKTALIFLDSGGYELSKDYDSCELRRSPYKPKEEDYGLEQYQAVLESIASADPMIPSVIANFDWGTRHKPIEDQIRAARELFDHHPQHLTAFIIKPGKGRTVVEPNSLSDDDYSNLNGFDIIGVTEKELGKDLKARLKRMASLRRHLDNAGINAPIHLWGGLDPILTPLFFFAGAEVFDGLSWLRYAFRHGVAMHRECGVLFDENLGIKTGADLANQLTSILNRQAMEKLEISLQTWVDFAGENFDMFDVHVKDHLRNAYNEMTTWDASLKGGN